MKGTVKEILAANPDIKPADLNVFLRIASKVGMAEIVGYDTTNYAGRGRVPAIWEIKEGSFEINLDSIKGI